jgi:hypothetical protein
MQSAEKSSAAEMGNVAARFSIMSMLKMCYVSEGFLGRCRAPACLPVGLL